MEAIGEHIVGIILVVMFTIPILIRLFGPSEGQVDDEHPSE